MKRKPELTILSRVALVFLLFPLFLQSCTEEELIASVDGDRLRETGPSHDHPFHTKYTLGENVGFIFLTSGGSFSPADKAKANKGKTSLNNSKHESEYLLANSSNKYEWYYNDATDKSKTSSDFLDHIYLMDGIEFIQKRSNSEGTIFTFNYLEAPFYAIYSYDLDDGNIFGGIGPYFAYGVGGNIKSTFKGQTTKDKIFSDKSDFKRFDAGATITVGYKMPESFRFDIAYDIGLVNIEKNGFGDKTKNRSFSLNVSYQLNKIIKKKEKTSSK